MWVPVGMTDYRRIRVHFASSSLWSARRLCAGTPVCDQGAAGFIERKVAVGHERGAGRLTVTPLDPQQHLEELRMTGLAAPPLAREQTLAEVSQVCRFGHVFGGRLRSPRVAAAQHQDA